MPNVLHLIVFTRETERRITGTEATSVEQSPIKVSVSFTDGKKVSKEPSKYKWDVLKKPYLL